MSDERHVYGTPAEFTPAEIECVQLTRQLRLLIEAVEAFVETLRPLCIPGDQAVMIMTTYRPLMDRIETAKAHLS